MMNSTSMHKMVVGIGLAAVIGVGVSVFAVRAKHESEVARNTPAPAMLAPSDENATDAAASAQSAAAQPTDDTAPASSAPPSAAAASDVANDAAGAAAGEESRPVKSKASDRADRRVAKTRDSSDSLGTRVASAANSNSGPAGASADAQQDSAQTRQEAATSSAPAATSIEPLPSDSQITAYVKSEIATATPNSSVDITTTDGVVALSGSVPSQDAVEQARRAAQRVPGVKQVDASGLTVTNQ
jgi:hyperosmotically inducible protein